MGDKEIRPCPFCGGEAVSYTSQVGVMMFRCANETDCGAVVSFDNDKGFTSLASGDYAGYERENMAAWNRRVSGPGDSESQLEALTDAHRHLKSLLDSVTSEKLGEKWDLEDGRIVRIWLDDARYARERECEYQPEVLHSFYDEDDEEHMTTEGDADGSYCFCSVCGYTMMTGDMGWFDEERGPLGGILYRPRFRYCPECGAAVQPHVSREVE